MLEIKKKPAPLIFKPDLDEAAKRWDAFFEGEIIDRPVVEVTAPLQEIDSIKKDDYYDFVYGDMDDLIDRALLRAERTYYGGEAIPEFRISLGPDEFAFFCGAEIGWSEGMTSTNWSKPFVEDWEKSFPIQLQQDNPMWQRILLFFQRASDRMAGKILLPPPDLHTNMDLLASIRGPQRLCLDLLDTPELIDRAMLDAREVFKAAWPALVKAGKMDMLGYSNDVYSMDGAAVLQCDFSCMISPQMFRRWVLPALEEEAGIVKHVMYHWDGPGALVHLNDIVASKSLHTLGYVWGAGNGTLLDNLDLFKKLQASGKSVFVWGSKEEVMAAHRELKPEKTMYRTHVGSQAEADDLLKWFVRNT